MAGFPGNGRIWSKRSKKLFDPSAAAFSECPRQRNREIALCPSGMVRAEQCASELNGHAGPASDEILLKANLPLGAGRSISALGEFLTR